MNSLFLFLYQHHHEEQKHNFPFLLFFYRQPLPLLHYMLLLLIILNLVPVFFLLKILKIALHSFFVLHRDIHQLYHIEYYQMLYPHKLNLHLIHQLLTFLHFHILLLILMRHICVLLLLIMNHLQLFQYLLPPFVIMHFPLLF